MDTSEMTVTLTPQMLATIPLLAVAMQFLKGIEPLAKLQPWFPLLSLALAIGAAIVLGMGDTIQARVMSGIIMGLATSGGYDAAKVPGKAVQPGPTP
ncbi:MAG TPA: hypothetical protein PLL20_19405 [Phycisphaerae bacterium]|nr:hypothetical protein [Phycisphaerae bacterium]